MSGVAAITAAVYILHKEDIAFAHTDLAKALSSGISFESFICSKACLYVLCDMKFHESLSAFGVQLFSIGIVA